MGVLYCACRQAGDINCALCDFATVHNPVKMFRKITWPGPLNPPQRDVSVLGIDDAQGFIPIDALDALEMFLTDQHGPVSIIEITRLAEEPSDDERE